jgi:GNAT superfamily N-acetyltransferase
VATPTTFCGVEPSSLTGREFDACLALIREGGEVSAAGLEGRVKGAARLARLYVGTKLCGVAALKRPELGYRSSVAAKAAIQLPADVYPYELGYVYVIPEERGKGFSRELVREALAGAEAAGVFATTRSSNAAMQATLTKGGFTRQGNFFPSSLGDENLHLFVRGGLIRRPANER